MTLSGRSKQITEFTSLGHDYFDMATQKSTVILTFLERLSFFSLEQ